MRACDTSLGGSEKRFPETTLGLVSRLHASDGADFRKGFEDLCRRYWKPVYAYVRVALVRSNEEAKDLTQAFFLWLLEGEAVRSFDAERGGFRPYLKLLLRRFTVHQDLARLRLKRGGGVGFMSLEGSAGLAEAVPDLRCPDPEKAFDRTWVWGLLQGALERVKSRCVTEGRASAFRAYEEYDLSTGSSRPTYGELGARLGLTENQVRFGLFSVREEVRSELRRELARLTPDDRELEAEWHELFGR